MIMNLVDRRCVCKKQMISFHNNKIKCTASVVIMLNYLKYFIEHTMYLINFIKI